MHRTHSLLIEDSKPSAALLPQQVHPSYRKTDAELTPSRRGFLLSAAALGAGLFVPFRTYAADAQAAPAVASAPPQRVMLSISEDPAHCVSVVWRAQGQIEKPQVQIAPLTAAPLTDKDAIAFPASPQAPLTTATGELVYSYAHSIKGLNPATQYCYRVGDGTSWSEWNVFRTAEASAAPFKFLYLGDVQNDIRSMCTRAMRKAYQHAPDAALALFAGDLVTDGWDDNLWSEFAYATSVLSQTMPCLPTPGNHDTKTKTPMTYPYGAHPAYHAHFKLPENGPENTPGLKQEAYFVDYQGVRFISLNTNAFEDDAPQEVQKAQLRWFEKLLAENPNRWTIVTHHHPIYSVSEGRDNEYLRGLLRPLYDKYRVDLVLQGHDHAYGRTHKVAGDKIVGASDPGTVYVVSVSGPKQYEVGPKFGDLMAKTAGHMQLYQVVEVSSDRLAMDTFGIDGQRLDGFQLTKDASGMSTYSTT
ncbi:MAG: metallophosphoesterase family protein [Candidatus Hydrogenedentes bacterium]|nr:metallophosphoesterase family protein [Candidatus Hydrogenedentota bacterium]